ncbi:NAD(P)-dependent dehydrogenase (short-subunit alcohol dehydrogenase family) [Geomicrobium halophilum]|uniref:NAD(P)-dependent dehydrogenase (Short-subunit alcohol dehydrogenase family) n=1 Tax=Geomicrobium halophilum TaxID=549000 RepID=A0A841Q0R6_9BACL|nr:SDR family oxidoreductase [Geomicrobium halophilum]MBB6449128.1 NAD(P)-dependent dehydrogenase (short-subunit alcohol dehydrogenase family) [Geomicrobium halophilum]
MYLPSNHSERNFSVQGKNIVITGANSGIGKETAEVLAARGAHVTMASRDIRRGEEARTDILTRIPYANIDVHCCHLASLESIQTFIQAFKAKHDKLYALINNAGVVTVKRETTEDGFEMMLGVNHLGHFYLTTQLLPLLERTEEARIITLASGAYKSGRIHFSDPHLEKNFGIWKGYTQSKFANVLFTVELAQRLKTNFLNVVSVHPGAVSTQLGVHRETGFGKQIHAVLRPLFQNAREGAETSIHLASSRELVNGGYYYKKKRQDLKSRALNTQLAKDFWEWSEREIASRGF